MLNAYVSQILRIQAAKAAGATKKTTSLALGKRQAAWPLWSKKRIGPESAFTPCDQTNHYGLASESCLLIRQALQRVQSSYHMAAVQEHFGFGKVPVLPLLKLYHEAYNKPQACYHSDLYFELDPRILEQLNNDLPSAYLPSASNAYQKLGQSYLAYGVYFYQSLLEDGWDLGQQNGILQQLTSSKYALAHDQLCREIGSSFDALYPYILPNQSFTYNSVITCSCMDNAGAAYPYVIRHVKPALYSSASIYNAGSCSQTLTKPSKTTPRHVACNEGSDTSGISSCILSGGCTLASQSPFSQTQSQVIQSQAHTQHLAGSLNYLTELSPAGGHCENNAQAIRIKHLTTFLNIAQGSIAGLELLLKQQHNPLCECLLEQLMLVELQPDFAIQDQDVQLSLNELIASQCFDKSSQDSLSFYCQLSRKQLRKLCNEYLQQCDQSLRQAVPFSLQHALVNANFVHHTFIQQINHALAAASDNPTHALPWKICFSQSSKSHLHWRHLWQALYCADVGAAGAGAKAKESTAADQYSSRIDNIEACLAKSALAQPALAAARPASDDPTLESNHAKFTLVSAPSAPTWFKPVLLGFDSPDAGLLAQLCSYEATQLDVHWPCPVHQPYSDKECLDFPEVATLLGTACTVEAPCGNRWATADKELLEDSKFIKHSPLEHITNLKNLLQKNQQPQSKLQHKPNQPSSVSQASLPYDALVQKALEAQNFYSAPLNLAVTSQVLKQQDVLAGIHMLEDCDLAIEIEQRALMYKGLQQLQHLWQNYPLFMRYLAPKHGLVFYLSSLWHFTQVFSQALGPILELCGVVPLKLASRGEPLALAMCLAKLLPFLPEMVQPEGAAPTHVLDKVAPEHGDAHFVGDVQHGGDMQLYWQEIGQILLNTAWQHLQLELPCSSKLSSNFIKPWTQHQSKLQVHFLRLSSKDLKKISKLLDLPVDGNLKHLLRKFLPDFVIDHILQFNSTQALSELLALQQISMDAPTYLKNISMDWFVPMLQKSTTNIEPHQLLAQMLSYVLKEPVENFTASLERRLLLGALYVFSYAGQPNFSLAVPSLTQGCPNASVGAVQNDLAYERLAHENLALQAAGDAGEWQELPSQDLQVVSELKLVVHNFEQLTLPLRELLISVGRNLVSSHVATAQRSQCYALIAQYFKHRASCALSSPWLDLIDLAQTCCDFSTPEGATSWATTALCHQLKAQVFKTLGQLYWQVTGVEPHSLLQYRSQNVELQQDFSTVLKNQMINDIKAHRELLRIGDVQDFLIYTTPDCALSDKGE